MLSEGREIIATNNYEKYTQTTNSKFTSHSSDKKGSRQAEGSIEAI
jgi:hypothetical protein